MVLPIVTLDGLRRAARLASKGFCGSRSRQCWMSTSAYLWWPDDGSGCMGRTVPYKIFASEPYSKQEDTASLVVCT